VIRNEGLELLLRNDTVVICVDLTEELGKVSQVALVLSELKVLEYSKKVSKEYFRVVYFVLLVQDFFSGQSLLTLSGTSKETL
jgi:hypothetical protein